MREEKCENVPPNPPYPSLHHSASRKKRGEKKEKKSENSICWMEPMMKISQGGEKRNFYTIHAEEVFCNKKLAEKG